MGGVVVVRRRLLSTEAARQTSTDKRHGGETVSRNVLTAALLQNSLSVFQVIGGKQTPCEDLADAQGNVQQQVKRERCTGNRRRKPTCKGRLVWFSRPSVD